MEIKFTQTTPDDLVELAENILPADRTEILAMGVTVEWALKNSLETSLEAVTCRADGRVACVTGVCQSVALSDTVAPWLISTPIILSHPRPTLHYSRLILNKWLPEHPYMANYVDCRHFRAIRWLKWLGANLHEPSPVGPYSRPFHKFTFGEPNVC